MLAGMKAGEESRKPWERREKRAGSRGEGGGRGEEAEGKAGKEGRMDKAQREGRGGDDLIVLIPICSVNRSLERFVLYFLHLQSLNYIK